MGWIEGVGGGRSGCPGDRHTRIIDGHQSSCDRHVRRVQVAGDGGRRVRGAIAAERNRILVARPGKGVLEGKVAVVHDEEDVRRHVLADEHGGPGVVRHRDGVRRRGKRHGRPENHEERPHGEEASRRGFEFRGPCPFHDRALPFKSSADRIRQSPRTSTLR